MLERVVKENGVEGLVRPRQLKRPDTRLDPTLSCNPARLGRRIEAHDAPTAAKQRRTRPALTAPHIEQGAGL